MSSIERILEYLKDKDQVDVRTISNDLGLTVRTVKNAINNILTVQNSSVRISVVDITKDVVKVENIIADEQVYMSDIDKLSSTFKKIYNSL